LTGLGNFIGMSDLALCKFWQNLHLPATGQPNHTDIVAHFELPLLLFTLNAKHVKILLDKPVKILPIIKICLGQATMFKRDDGFHWAL
jgi:hypothetical protein